MEYRLIEMEGYARRAHFEYFRRMKQPYVGLTVNVEITEFLRMIREKGYPFFLTVLYAAANAGNLVIPLRQRIVEEGIVEYGNCKTSHTVALADGTYCYCKLDSSMEFENYIGQAAGVQERAKAEASLEDGEDSASLFFVSSLPWVSYAALVQPTPEPADSNPRITFGKYYEENGKVLMPVSLLANHALVDGKDIAAFYDEFQKMMESMVAAYGCR